MKGRDPVRSVFPQQLMLVDGQNYNVLCCLNHVVWAGSVDWEAARAGVRSAWVEFVELAPVLTSRGASLKVKA